MQVATIQRSMAGILYLCMSCSSNGGAPALGLVGTAGTGQTATGSSTGGKSSTSSTNLVGGSATAGGSTSVGGSTSAGGSTSTGGSSGSVGGSTTTGGKSSSGGSTSTGGKSTTAGGTTATGGTGGARGGQTSVGGASTGGGTSAATELAKSQCDGKPGPSYAQFFDNSKLATLKVTIDPASLAGKTSAQWLDALWSTWDHCAPGQKYTTAKFEYSSPDSAGNVACSNVGIKLRGSWTREQAAGLVQTRGFKLDMQVLDTAATTHRRFADLNRINILSIESDPSHLLQCISYKMLRNFGVPAPQCNHLKVYVNGAYYGLLENVEQVNKGYARRHFGTNTGSLYAGSPGNGDCPNGIQDSTAKLTYSGDAFSNYTSQYELTNATAADAEKNLIPMLKCGDKTQTADDATFKTCIAQWIDVTEWLHLIAAESVMPELESFIGYYRNFYLHFTPDSSAPHGGRFQIWPWDLDTALQRNTCSPSSCDPFTAVDSFYGPRNARAALVTRLTTVFRTEYCTALRAFLSTTYKTSFVDDMAKVIEAGIAGDSSVTPTAWQAEVTAMRNHITTRTAAAQTQIDATCK